MEDHLILFRHRKKIQLLGVHLAICLLCLGLVVEANSSNRKWIDLVEGVLNGDLLQDVANAVVRQSYGGM